MKSYRSPGRHGRHTHRGITMLMVLVILAVMLLGGLAAARFTEIGTLAAGNATYRETSLHASEVGLNTAFAALLAVTNEDTDVSPWYWATMQATDAQGVPTSVNWNKTPDVTVGGYDIRYSVERLCNTTPITAPSQQCLVYEQPDPYGSGAQGKDPLDPPQVRQFRITVRVTGPKNTETWVQSLVTRNST